MNVNPDYPIINGVLYKPQFDSSIFAIGKTIHANNTNIYTLPNFDIKGIITNVTIFELTISYWDSVTNALITKIINISDYQIGNIALTLL